MAEVKIENLGSEGDGIGRIDGKPIYVTGALPGETVRISGPGPHFATSEILTPSKERQSPPCPHFSTCGGCTFQHASLPMLLQWKRAEVALAFKKAGIDVAVDETFASAPSSRRRVTFSARRDGKGVLLGFKERGQRQSRHPADLHHLIAGTGSANFAPAGHCLNHVAWQ